MTLVNADFSQRASMTPDRHQWIPSPQAGVERILLDRVGREQARATSLVRYAPGSHFPAHSHPGGEEILVLSGTFSEEGIDYPAGWYLRSPDGSTHQPSSRPGCTIFVKLRQMAMDEHHPVRLDTKDPKNWHDQPQGQMCPLFSNAYETVMLQRYHPGSPIVDLPLYAGAELLVLDGVLTTAATAYPAGSWLRLPPGDTLALVAGQAGALCYLKIGHLSPTTLQGIQP